MSCFGMWLIVTNILLIKKTLKSCRNAISLQTDNNNNNNIIIIIINNSNNNNNHYYNSCSP